jgi:DNA polymerase-3 subunit alpha
MSFFNQAAKQSDYSIDKHSLPQIPPWPEQQMLAYEKEVLGFYVTSNPLSHCAETISAYSTHNTSELAQVREGQQIVIGGIIAKCRTMLTKKGKNAGQKMAVFVLEDLQGKAEVVLFPETLNKFADLVVEDTVVFVKGKVDHKREMPNIFAAELIKLENVREKLAAKVRIEMASAKVSKEMVEQIKTICKRHRGNSPVYLSVKTDKGTVHTRADASFSVNPDVEFCNKMKQLVGDENFQLTR